MARKVILSGPEKWLQPKVEHYSHEKYWKMRERVVRYRGGFFEKILCTWYLFRIKRMDAFNNASMGTHLGYGAQFAEPPHLPHGIKGIILSHETVIGKNCTILHQVTIGGGKGGAPVIGDNVEIGAGAMLVGGIHIGNNVRIGANCVVAEDIPDNCTVVMPHPRILSRSQATSD